MSELDIFLLDDSNNLSEEINIKRPNTFEELMNTIRSKFKQLPSHYVLFYTGENSKDQIIHNDKDFEKVEDIIFIRKIKPVVDLTTSIFTRNIEKLPEPQKEKFTIKYTCSICSDLIKDENPLFCYVCQKIFHHECLKNWDKQRKENYRKLNCPNCRKELPLEDWKAKLDFEEIRKNDAEIMNLLNEIDDSSSSMKYSDFIEKSVEIFKNILTKIKNIRDMIVEEDNEKIINLIKELSVNYINPPLDDISVIIFEELEFIDNFLKQNEEKDEKKNKGVKKEEQNGENVKYKNEIKLIYLANSNTAYRIFGHNFVENNKDNIDLVIDGKTIKLTEEATLKEGDAEVTIKIKKKLTNLSFMFSNCTHLKNIDELKFLDTTGVTSFESMFEGCKLIMDINALLNWDVSKSTTFKGMFEKCVALSDINVLLNWDVSNCTNFTDMFSLCISLKDITALQYWDVSKSTSFAFMFYGCASLSNLKPLEKWNVSNSTSFSAIFCSCPLISDLSPISRWNVSNCKNFQGMFSNSKYLVDLKPIQNWNVSKGENFSGMFYCCDKLTDVSPLKNWNVSKGTQFNNMFENCPKLANIDALKSWNLSQNNFKSMKK